MPVFIMESESYKLLNTIFIGFLFLAANEFNWVVEASKVQCIDSEREALLSFKEGFTSPSSRFSSWVADDRDCCKWSGVGCNNRTGHVIILDLHSSDSSQQLQGQLTASLLDLPYLSFLDLSLNDFNQMPIPEFIGSLYNLKYLNLSDANFRGIITDHLGNLSSLQTVDLSGNSFSLKANNLDWISGLSSLQVLDLGGVDLSNAVNWLDAVNMLPSLLKLSLFLCRLPTPQQSLSIVNFTSLEVLNLSFNNFCSTIPNWLVQISHTLQHLNLTRCQLQGSIPNSFINFTSLTVLDFSFNKLTGSIPHNFGNMTSLVVLDMSFNRLEGPIPATLGLIQEMHHYKQSPLRELHLSNNKLTGSFEKILPQLSELVILEVASNFLQGLITEVHLQNFSTLRVLDLSANALILNVSSNWIPPFQLEIVRLQSCQMSPRLFPLWLQNQKKVLEVDISKASISDTIPHWFWDLSPSMTHLDLSSNQLRGTLPDLSPRVSLSSLDLGDNKLSGLLPHFPLNMERLILAGNEFSGPISAICDMLNEHSVISHLDLSENLLTGLLPDCWTYGRNMVVLNLRDNQLSGQIPDSIGHLVNLKVLSLAANKISGEIPHSLRNCTSLFFLNLGMNELSGSIPAWLGESLENLQILSLRKNMFRGNIPLQMCQLKYIEILDLSFNFLSGRIPGCINDFLVISEKEAERSSLYYDHASYTRNELMKQMWIDSPSLFVRVLDLSSNRLAGEIPREVTELVGLASLNLSNNGLAGIIPSDIGEMRLLEVLDLSKNQLSCSIPTSMPNLSFLEVLNLSYNKLSGKIPSGEQFNTFVSTSFLGNVDLCGPLLEKKCSEDKPYKDPNCVNKDLESDLNRDEADTGHGFEITPFYISIGAGFITGFWGFWVPLLVHTPWRHAYFRFVGSVIDQIYVWIVVAINRLQRKFQPQEEQGRK